MLCHLCGFGVLGSGLIYDFVKRLIDSFTPLDIELILSVLTRAYKFVDHLPNEGS